MLAHAFNLLGGGTTAVFVDNIKSFGYRYATLSGLSISAEDMVLPETKQKHLDEATQKVTYIQKKYWEGCLTDEEKYTQSIIVWGGVKKLIEADMKEGFDESNHIYNFIDS